MADLNDLGNYDWRFSPRNVWKVERHLQVIPHTTIRSSDARYQKWHRRYLEFIKLNPGQSPDYYPTRPTLGALMLIQTPARMSKPPIVLLT